MANPQSGRSSAVGLVPETTWRTLPFVVGTPGTIGIASTNPLRFCIVEAGGGFPVNPGKDVARGEVDGGINTRRVTLTDKSYAGKDTIKVDPESLYYPLLGIMGQDNQLSPGAGAFTHQMRPNITVNSFSCIESFGQGTYGRVTTGNYVDKLDLTFGKILSAAYSMTGFRQVPNTYPNAAGVDTLYDCRGDTGWIVPIAMGGDGTKTVKLPASPTYIDVAETLSGNGPLVFAGMGFGTQTGFSTAFVTINGSAAPVTILPGATLSIQRMLEQFLVGGSGYDPGAVVSNGVEVTGKMDLLFQDNSIVQATLNNSSIGINFKFTGIVIGATVYKYALEVFLPRVKFLQAQADRPATAMMTGGNFIAELDTTKADSYSPQGFAVQITLTNSLDATSIAVGTAGSGLGPGVLTTT